MASPYDSAISMFDLPRYAGLQESFVFPRREAPADNARRAFLEVGSQAAPEDEEWNLAMQSPDPMGVMEELKKVREERETEDLIASIAELDPAAKDYLTKIRGTMAQQPKAFATPAVGRILDFQQRMMPPKRPAPAFQYPQFQSQYQKLVTGGADPQAAADEVQAAEQQYGLQRQLAASGLPFDSPDTMTEGKLDELKVLQTLARAKNEAKQKTDRIPIPNELNKALQEAYSAEDDEAISDAARAITQYQAKMASILASGKPVKQVPQADLKRVDEVAPTTAPPAPTVAPQAAAPIQPPSSVQISAPKVSEEQLQSQALAVAPQKLSVDAQHALKTLGVPKLLEFYMAKTPENPTNPGDVESANDSKKEMQAELLKELGTTNAAALSEAADLINELMGPYGYRTKAEIDQQPRFVNAQGSQAPVIKAIRLKTS